MAPFKSQIVRISRLRAVLEYKKSPKKRNRPPRSVETLGVTGKNIVHQRSVETLGLSRHGDDKKSISKRARKVKRGVQK